MDTTLKGTTNKMMQVEKTLYRTLCNLVLELELLNTKALHTNHYNLKRRYIEHVSKVKEKLNL